MIEVIAPIGGFGNHVRWIIWLSLKNSSPTWPIDTVEQRFKFIKNKIYPPSRTWHNWLHIEMKIRERLEGKLFKDIIFDHDPEQDRIGGRNREIVVLIASPDVCYKNYLKFNSSLNDDGLPRWRKFIDVHNKTYTDLPKKDNTLVLNSECLYNPVLDYKFYDQLVKFLNIDNLYDHAKIIHKMWYDCQINAEKEFVEEATRIYQE